LSTICIPLCFRTPTFAASDRKVFLFQLTGLQPARRKSTVRKLAATLFAGRDVNEAQLNAWFGWRGGGMASLYSKEANRKRMSKSTGQLLSIRPGTNDE
jgi:hypothetical protein